MAAPSPHTPMKNKKFYQRKRLWIPIIIFILIATPFVLNPIKSFRKTVTFSLRLFGIKEYYLKKRTFWVHYYEGGTGHSETVILLHGFGGNALLTWMQLLPALSRKYHVIAPDLLASNFLRMNPKTYSVDLEERLVMNLMDGLHIEKADFVGLSVGGWISLLIAKDHPERVNKLILVESAGLKTKVPELARLTLTDRAKARHFLKLLFYYPPPLPDFVLDQMIRSSTHIKKRYQAVFAGFIENSKGRLLDGQLADITQPTLILQGREDQVIPLEVAERLHQGLPHSELKILEKSGHAAVWDSPRVLKKDILQFLSERAQ